MEIKLKLRGECNFIASTISVLKVFNNLLLLGLFTSTLPNSTGICFSAGSIKNIASNVSLLKASNDGRKKIVGPPNRRSLFLFAWVMQIAKVLQIYNPTATWSSNRPRLAIWIRRKICQTLRI